jgi:UTP:GlnB (protein PII) uridylyltransferase
MTDEALEFLHLERARQELGALIDAMDTMGDVARFLPDLRRVADQMDADLDTLRAAMET